MKFTTKPQAEIRAELTAIRAELNALHREAKSLPLCTENLARLQQIQDRRNALDEEFRALGALLVTH